MDFNFVDENMRLIFTCTKKSEVQQMEHGKFESVAAEIRKIGYKLASMRFEDSKGNSITLFVDKAESQEEPAKEGEMKTGGTWNYPSRV